MGQVSPVTTSFMRALPAALRPNPYNIDESVMLAVGNGWDIHDLARLCWVNERNPTAAPRPQSGICCGGFGLPNPSTPFPRWCPHLLR